MTVLKTVQRVSASYMGYVFLLLAFVSLGLFVASLASGSSLAVIAGIATVVCLGLTAVGFRMGAGTLARATKRGLPTHNVSIFSTPLDREEIDQYREQYRSPQQAGLTVLVGRDGGTSRIATVVPERLSA